MKPLVFNSTPLIYLTEAGLGKVFEELKGEKITSSEVLREVVDEGKRRGIPDAIVLHEMFENGVFKVREPMDKKFLSRLLETRGLQLTDAEVLTLAHEIAAIAVIDDEVARKTAKVYGVDCVGSPYVLMRAVYEGLVPKAEAKRAVNDLVSKGWRCSVENYAMIMQAMGR